jgi:hypothetical protein
MCSSGRLCSMAVCVTFFQVHLSSIAQALIHSVRLHPTPWTTFLNELLNHCCTKTLEELCPRRLTLLLMHLSIGSSVNTAQPLQLLYAEAFCQLARTTISEILLLEKPNFDAIHAIISDNHPGYAKRPSIDCQWLKYYQLLMIWHHVMFLDDKNAVGCTWHLLGIAAKLAIGVWAFCFGNLKDHKFLMTAAYS